MATRKVLLDGGVLNQINKGNQPVANKLKAMLAPGSGVKVYVADQALMELTGQPGKLSGGVGPDLPRSAAAAQRFLQDLQLEVAPAPPGGWDNVVKQYKANEKAGNLIAVDDLRLVIEATNLDAELWSMDQKTFVKQPGNFQKNFPNLKIAAESALPISTKPNDYRVGRTLMGLKPIIVSFHGEISDPPPTGGGGSGGGGAGEEELTAPIGEEVVPLELGGTGALGGGLLLLFQGIQMALNVELDQRNKEAIKEDLKLMGPGISKNRRADPSQGVLLVFYFRAGADGPIGTVKGGAAYLAVADFYGHTEDEAKQAWWRTPTATEQDVITQTSWIEPLVPIGVDEIATPFKQFALGTFIHGKEMLQDVMLDYTGFDDEGTTNLDVPDGMTPQFIILDPPETLKWSDAYSDYTTGVNRVWRKVGEGNARIPVVFLDPDLSFFFFDVSAAMVFPADDDTRDLFEDTPETDNGHFLNRVNLKLMRWVRPENIRLICPWDTVGTPGSVLTSVAPRGGRFRPDSRFVPNAGDLAPPDQWGKLLDGSPRVYIVAKNDGARQNRPPSLWRSIEVAAHSGRQQEQDRPASEDALSGTETADSPGHKRGPRALHARRRRRSPHRLSTPTLRLHKWAALGGRVGRRSNHPRIE